MPRRQTLREKIEQRVARNKGEDVFLTREFKKLGGEAHFIERTPRFLGLVGLWPRDKNTHRL